MTDERTTSREPPTELADGTLAAAALAIALAVVRSREIEVTPSAVLLGAASAVGFELLAGRNPDRVRRLWAPTDGQGRGRRHSALSRCARRNRVRWLVVAGTAALACYLVVLALVVSGIVPPPGSWAAER